MDGCLFSFAEVQDSSQRPWNIDSILLILNFKQEIYQAKELIESNVQIRQALCATIIDTDRVCLGTEDGLFCIELMKESKLILAVSAVVV